MSGRPVWAYTRGAPLAAGEAEHVEGELWSTVQANSQMGHDATDPAMVTHRRRLPAAMYWSAAREVVDVDGARESLLALGAHARTTGSRRGLVGAAAAIAWPGNHPTFELIAYRHPDREGSRRSVNAASVQAAQRRFPELFLCHDPRTRRLMVAPHTRCPILFGLRATTPDVLPAALRMIESEPWERWIIFRTNQGSGDHLVDRATSDLAPYLPGRLRGHVSGAPQGIRGGHVRFELVDETGGRVDCWAFEPTKTLPAVARALRAGDEVRVWGGRGSDPGFRIEGIELLSVADRFGRPRPPKCPDCVLPARSLGTGRGYRCDRCHRRMPPEAAVGRREPARVSTGTYHPTPSARRHLHPRAPEP